MRIKGWHLCTLDNVIILLECYKHFYIGDVDYIINDLSVN